MPQLLLQLGDFAEGAPGGGDEISQLIIFSSCILSGRLCWAASTPFDDCVVVTARRRRVALNSTQNAKPSPACGWRCWCCALSLSLLPWTNNAFNLLLPLVLTQDPCPYHRVPPMQPVGCAMSPLAASHARSRAVSGHRSGLHCSLLGEEVTVGGSAFPFPGTPCPTYNALCPWALSSLLGWLMALAHTLSEHRSAPAQLLQRCDPRWQRAFALLSHHQQPECRVPSKALPARSAGASSPPRPCHQAGRMLAPVR
jgi:hypothetical protein